MNISNSLYKEFRAAYNTGKYNGQRYGQAFFNHFNLHKVQSEKGKLNVLYNADHAHAVAIITSMIDYEN